MIAVYILAAVAILSAPAIGWLKSRKTRRHYITLRPRIGMERKGK